MRRHKRYVLNSALLVCAFSASNAVGNYNKSCELELINSISSINLPIKFENTKFKLLFKFDNCLTKLKSYFSNYLITDNNIIVNYNFNGITFNHSSLKISNVKTIELNENRLRISYDASDLNRRISVESVEYIVIGGFSGEFSPKFEGMIFNAIDGFRPLFWFENYIAIPAIDHITQCNILGAQLQKKIAGCL